MELTMTNGFCEMNETEMLEVDGGLTSEEVASICVGVAAFSVCTAVGFAVGGPVGAAFGAKNGAAIGTIVGGAVGTLAGSGTTYLINQLVKSDN